MECQTFLGCEKGKYLFQVYKDEDPSQQCPKEKQASDQEKWNSHSLMVRSSNHHNTIIKLTQGPPDPNIFLREFRGIKPHIYDVPDGQKGCTC